MMGLCNATSDWRTFVDLGIEEWKKMFRLESTTDKSAIKNARKMCLQPSRHMELTERCII